MGTFETDKSYAAKVRNIIIKKISTGCCDIDKVAVELNVSKRTLQRRLVNEDTTYNQQLNHIREMLVKSYLESEMSLEEIAKLINYRNVKSLSRAFKVWTGVTITEYKKKERECIMSTVWMDEMK